MGAASPSVKSKSFDDAALAGDTPPIVIGFRLAPVVGEAARLTRDRRHGVGNSTGMPGRPSIGDYLGKMALVGRGQVKASI
jgi:hypothetical protein